MCRSIGKTVTARFSDWNSRGAAEHRQISAHAGEFARALDKQLKAYVAFEDVVTAPAPGILDGMPYALKDMFVSSTRTPHGGLAQPLPMDHRPAGRQFSTLLDHAGARRIGYTAMTELAFEPSGYNAVHGAPKNPWNFDFITGGSSSGSAVAVASGSAVFALGSDTGGSLRIPAHCCGVTSWKPTYGVVSLGRHDAPFPEPGHCRHPRPQRVRIYSKPARVLRCRRSLNPSARSRRSRMSRPF